MMTDPYPGCPGDQFWESVNGSEPGQSVIPIRRSFRVEDNYTHMLHMYKFKYGTLFLLLSGLHAQEPGDIDEENRNSRDLKKMINRLQGEVSGTERLDLTKASINLYNRDDLFAILVYWTQKEYSRLELAWWKAHYRDARLLILCLYRMKFGNGDVSNLPDFKQASGRFDQAEAKLRTEEIEEVRARYDEIKAALASLVARTEVRLGDGTPRKRR